MIVAPASHRSPTRGKAGTLAELARAGFAVPEFACSPNNLAETVRRLGFPLAVRSSASAEDGPRHSFAGLFESYLGLQTLGEVEEAVARCRVSLASPQVREYCRRRGIDASSLKMDVIVQRMIEPDYCGVAFTVNPATGEEQVVIETCRGRGDELLAGRASPLPADFGLPASRRTAVVRLARRIERHFGAPQDIEFAVAGGDVFVLQARPITQIQFAPRVGRWTTAGLRDGGVSASVCTPLMASLYDLAFSEAVRGFLRDLRIPAAGFPVLRMFFGRPYWNVGEVKRQIAHLPGFVERDFDDSLGVQCDYEGEGRTTPIRLSTVLAALPSVIAAAGLYRRREDECRRFLSGGYEKLVEEFRPAAPNPDANFARLIDGAYRRVEVSYFKTVFTASLARADFSASFPDAPCNVLLSGLPKLAHLDADAALRELADRGETDVRGIVRAFPYHSRRELDIRAPRWDEDLAFVEELLRGMRERPQRRENGAVRPADAVSRATSGLGYWRRREFLKKLRRLRTFVHLREQMRDLSTRMYHLIRRYALAIADRRGLGDDIFFCTWREIVRDDRSNISRARRRFDAYRNFDAPHEIGRPPEATTRRGGEPAVADCAQPPTLRGISASCGRATGRAHVAKTIEAAARMRAGEILVCPFTDPGWTPLIGRAAAVVTEVGGLLSHAAVICREFDVPAVLGVRQATERIPDGAQVTVNGDAGAVYVTPAGEQAG
jgi:phosphohistidine swiveling domain-containing protein